MDQTNTIDLENMMKNLIKPIQIKDDSDNNLNDINITPSVSTKIQNVPTQNI